MKQDKRSIVRRRTQQLVYLELGRENGGVMLNLSEEGCGFQAITPVKCGETRFGFQINDGRRIAGDAEVVWADEAGVMGGLRFLNLPAEAHREIRLWLAETNAPPEHGFAPAAAIYEGGTGRSRAIGSEENVGRSANVRVAEEEAPMAPPPAWANLQAGAMEDDRYRLPFQHDEAPYRDPHRKSAALWRGIAGLATVVALAALVVMYQREVGNSLIWLGETLAGKAKASAVEPEKQSNPTVPSSASESNSASPGNQDDDKGLASQSPEDVASSPKPQKEVVDGSGREAQTVAPNTPNNGNPAEARPVSVLERQGATPEKAEPTWNQGDSVESLWGAVQSGSISAEVSLAERFARGDGVNKNCDQAKVLMKAAADHGNREARLRLYELETGGCR